MYSKYNVHITECVKWVQCTYYCECVYYVHTTVNLYSERVCIVCTMYILLWLCLVCTMYILLWVCIVCTMYMIPKAWTVSTIDVLMRVCLVSANSGMNNTLAKKKLVSFKTPSRLHFLSYTSGNLICYRRLHSTSMCIEIFRKYRKMWIQCHGPYSCN